ncbi:PVC-type heme-binding CxxCH protein [Membranihabitans marinus]|uniref:PVC-type heme-binding CxxCH protein n=1 Tax=Membranihabitans marinus TaxID=1227546 RepID=UPI001F2818C0|nr:PVC-type heme-binding CxxCH protein [Membranihabitans marinus]
MDSNNKYIKVDHKCGAMANPDKNSFYFSKTLKKIGCVVLSICCSSALYSQDQLLSIPDPDPSFQMNTLKPAPGFEVNLYAAEPLVEKPIQMNWDEEGRLWVVGSKQYPQPKPGERPDGKVYVLEDSDGDGQVDKSTVFADGLQVPTAVLPGDGGAYVANSTEILFLKDIDGDGKADEKTVMLSGFGTGDTHHLLHTFRWGPDGWMYFNQAVYIYSHVETPWGVKELEGGGVWRFQPSTLKLEVFARGLWNPWGLQFTEYGQTFLTDGAGFEGINYGFPDVVFQATPGAERIIHGLNPGKPKMTGVDFLNSSHLPDEMEGNIVTNDFRANRVNRYVLEELGSGYESKQVEDLLYSDNVAFRPVDVSIGPDGAIYIADWYNPIIQHGEVDFRDPRRDHVHGRIWRITAKDRALVQPPVLKGGSVSDLLAALKLPEPWSRNQARRLLKERGKDEVLPEVERWLASLSSQDEDYERCLLEAAWIIQSLDLTKNSLLEQLLVAEEHKVRAAAVRILHLDYERYPEAFSYFQKAIVDDHPMVRLEAAIALRNVKSAEAGRWALAALDREIDENIDFALWQTIRILEPEWLSAIKRNPSFLGNHQKTVYALKAVQDPYAMSVLTTMFVQGQVDSVYTDEVLRSIGKYGGVNEMNAMLQMAVKSQVDKTQYLDVLIMGAQSQQQVPNQGIERFEELLKVEDEAVVEKALQLIGLWQLSDYRSKLTPYIESENKNLGKTALTSLAMLTDVDSRELLRSFTTVENELDVRREAIRQWITVDIEEGAVMAAQILETLPDEENLSDLIQAFYSNQNGLSALASAWQSVAIPENVAAEGLAKIYRMNSRRQENPDVIALKQIFEKSGVEVVEPKMPQKLNPIAAGRLELDVKSNADPAKGELIYRKLGCASCHAIGGVGGMLGTDLSSIGANAPTDYIIGSILDPGAEIKDGYELNKVVKKNGMVVMGYLVRKTNNELVLRTVSGSEEVIPNYQIDSHENVSGSLMPPGLTAGLEREEFVDLVGFLSKIGEPGPYRISNKNLVRYWESLSVSDNTSIEINSGQWSKIIEGNDDWAWLPIHSMVSGSLPLSEVPVTDIKGQSFKIVKVNIKVDQLGRFDFYINSNGGEIWIDGQKTILQSHQWSAELEKGDHDLILVIAGNNSDSESLMMEMLDSSEGKGRFSLN